ncbi:MAG: hypothetical protein IT379_32990 [Deltaproteobacteria bacterium]|nr:hypothetical protein [Deltaproteobacteria bacterium]
MGRAGSYGSLLWVALLLLATGCAADASITGGGGPGDDDDTISDPGGMSTMPPPVGTPGECDTARPCSSGLVCMTVRGYARCVPPGFTDGSDDAGTPPASCGVCPPPNECRDGRCLAPDPGGASCEFDDACMDGLLCISGRCTADPRSGGCTTTADCPIGLMCLAGVCAPTPGTDGCVADADCGTGLFCEGGRCLSRELCSRPPDPDLSGVWAMQTVLNLREALPDWLAGFLDIVAEPFRFLAGDSRDLDTGLPGFVDSIVEEALRSFAAAYLPPWARDLLGAIADINDILSTWEIDEEMVLNPAGTSGVDYTGTHTWTRVSFEYRGRMVTGTPEEIIDFRITPSAFDAHATCGVLAIDRHDVNVSIGAVIAWLVNTIVYESSGGLYRSAEDALDDLAYGFCSGAADAVSGVVSVPGAYSLFLAACEDQLGNLIDDLIDALTMARVGFDAMTLKGSAPIESAVSLRPGVWEGTLLGGDFSGEFTATKR